MYFSKALFPWKASAKSSFAHNHPKLTATLRPVALFLLAAAATATLQAQGPAQGHPPAISDDSLSYYWGTNYGVPFESDNIHRHIVEFDHIDSQAWGGNMFQLFLRKSNMAEPAVGGGGGAFEAYIVERTKVSLHKPLHSAIDGSKILRDAFFSVGFNANIKNSTYAPAEKTILVGAGVQFKTPRKLPGMVELAAHYRKEWNHQGITSPGMSEEYDADYSIEPAWIIPIHLAGRDLTFKGMGAFNSPKGKSTLGIETKTEQIVRAHLSTDLGSFVSRNKKTGLALGAGFQYWGNFGGFPAHFDAGGGHIVHITGSRHFAPQLSLTVKLPSYGRK